MLSAIAAQHVSSPRNAGKINDLRDTFTRFYVRARILRVDCSRWLSVDPLWPGQRAYSYTENLPTQLTDPRGLAAVLVLPGIVLAGALLELLLLVLAITLAALLLFLLVWGLARLLSWICGKLRKLEKDVCGDPDGRPSDVIGGCCWSDSCLALFYKGQAYHRCAQLRILYSLLCYGGIDPPHLPPIFDNGFQAGKCMAIFAAKCIGSMPPFPGPFRFPPLWVYR